MVIMAIIIDVIWKGSELESVREGRGGGVELDIVE